MKTEICSVVIRVHLKHNAEQISQSTLKKMKLSEMRNRCTHVKLSMDKKNRYIAF